MQYLATGPKEAVPMVTLPRVRGIPLIRYVENWILILVPSRDFEGSENKTRDPLSELPWEGSDWGHSNTFLGNLQFEGLTGDSQAA